MPTNNFAQTDPAINAPYNRAVTITPSDSVDLTEITRALNISAAVSPTTVKVILSGDTVAVTLSLQTGKVYPIRASRVYATGTTATTVIALY